MLDNNLIENQMRPIALGRKNWLFAGSHQGAMRAAIFFSLINSCRMNSVNTWEYFTDVLPRLTSVGSEDLARLLPNVWHPPLNDGA
jgi:transposase